MKIWHWHMVPTICHVCETEEKLGQYCLGTFFFFCTACNSIGVEIYGIADSKFDHRHSHHSRSNRNINIEDTSPIWNIQCEPPSKSWLILPINDSSYQSNKKLTYLVHTTIFLSKRTRAKNILPPFLIYDADAVDFLHTTHTIKKIK